MSESRWYAGGNLGNDRSISRANFPLPPLHLEKEYFSPKIHDQRLSRARPPRQIASQRTQETHHRSTSDFHLEPRPHLRAENRLAESAQDQTELACERPRANLANSVAPNRELEWSTPDNAPPSEKLHQHPYQSCRADCLRAPF